MKSAAMELYILSRCLLQGRVFSNLIHLPQNLLKRNMLPHKENIAQTSINSFWRSKMKKFNGFFLVTETRKCFWKSETVLFMYLDKVVGTKKAGILQ